MTTGMCRLGVGFEPAENAQPSMPGIMTSSVITEGFSSFASRSPSSPVLAITTSKPFWRRCARRDPAVASSSITSTVPVLLTAAVGAVRARQLARHRSQAAIIFVSAASAGMRTVNVVPCPYSLSTVMSPP
jgi:hypothetical protein